MDKEKLNIDDMTCEEGEYSVADLALFRPEDLILAADTARTLPENPLLVAEALDRHIREEALAGRKTLTIAARIALPEVLCALRKQGYVVRQVRTDGPWRISWE